MYKVTYKPLTMKDVYDGEAKELFTVVSTFAGCGGSSTGYRLAGGKVLAINEFIPAARDSYKANYPTTHIFPQDIRKLTGEAILNKKKKKKGELDILDGSPPCSAFSMCGSREKGWGEVKKYSSTKQRVDDLFFEYARLIREVQPKVFVAENVKGLTVGESKNLLGDHEGSLFDDDKPKTIIDTLIDCGYKVDHRVLKAYHFGVPQIRTRLFIIGVRNDLGLKPSFPSDVSNPRFTVRDAWESLINDDIQAAWLLQQMKKYAIYKEAIKLKKSPDKTISSEKYFNLVRPSYDKPSPTITQTTASLGAAGIIHPSEDRKMTVPELKRLMSFPDDFKLTGGYSLQAERLGRAVPPLLMKALAKNIYERTLSVL